MIPKTPAPTYKTVVLFGTAKQCSECGAWVGAKTGPETHTQWHQRIDAAALRPPSAAD